MPRARCSTSARRRSLKARVGSYARGAGPFEPHRPDDRRDRRDGVRHHRDRNRGAAARSEPDQAAAGRATTSSCGTTSRCPTSCSPADHEAPQIVKHRGARNRQGDYFGPFASVWAVNRTINALQRAFLLRSCNDSYYENRTRPCLLFQIKRCSGPCTQRDRARRIPHPRRGGARLPVGQVERRQGAARRRDAARRPRTSNSSARRATATASRRSRPIQATQGHQHARRSRRPTSSRSTSRPGSSASRCSSSATGRTGATAPISRRPHKSMPPGEVLASFLAQFYDDKPAPRLILALARDRGLRASRRGAVDAGRGAGRDPRRQARRAAQPRRLRAAQRPRGAGAAARRHRLAAEAPDLARPGLRARRNRRGASRSTTTRTSWARTRSAP